MAIISCLGYLTHPETHFPAFLSAFKSFVLHTSAKELFSQFRLGHFHLAVLFSALHRSQDRTKILSHVYKGSRQPGSCLHGRAPSCSTPPWSPYSQAHWSSPECQVLSPPQSLSIKVPPVWSTIFWFPHECFLTKVGLKLHSHVPRGVSHRVPRCTL